MTSTPNESTHEGEPTLANDKSLRRNRAACLGVRRETWVNDPGLWETVEGVAERGIVVIPGRFDLPSMVLRELAIPYRVVPPHSLRQPFLEGAALVILGCPGRLENGGVTTLADYLDSGGGMLLTGHAGVVLQQLLDGPSYLMEATQSGSRHEVRAEIPELAGPMEGSWETHPGSRLVFLSPDAEGAESLLTAIPRGRVSGYPLAARLRVGSGSIMQLGCHLLETRPRPERNGHPAVGDRRWRELVQSHGEDALLGGITSESLDRAARAIRFFLWTIAQREDLARDIPLRGTPRTRLG